MAQGEFCRQQPQRRLRVTAERTLESQIGKLEIRNKYSGTATWAGMPRGAGAPAFPFVLFFFFGWGGECVALPWYRPVRSSSEPHFSQLLLLLCCTAISAVI